MMRVWRAHGTFFDSWCWEASFRRADEERVSLRGRRLTKRSAERAARRALTELAR